MNGLVKLCVYVLLLGTIALSGWQMFTTYTGDSPVVAMRQKSTKKPKVAKVKPASAATNTLTEATNTVESTATTTNEPLAEVVATNETAAATTPAAEPGATNQPPDVASTADNPPPGGEPASAGADKNFAPAARGVGKWFVTGILALVGLGGMLAWDASQFIGNRAVRFLYNDEGAGQKDPDYDVAEEEWNKGNYLEAVRLLREYVLKNPKQVHAFVRIAEIYEKDLNNNLAAALEYEEILRLKLPSERWGWCAIHLCNLYFKLGRHEDAGAMLRRIDAEHPETPAAEKARKRLEEMESAGYEVPKPKRVQAPIVAAAPPVEDTTPASNLPPGFRRKK